MHITQRAMPAVAAHNAESRAVLPASHTGVSYQCFFPVRRRDPGSETDAGCRMLRPAGKDQAESLSTRHLPLRLFNHRITTRADAGGPRTEIIPSAARRRSGNEPADWLGKP